MDAKLKASAVGHIPSGLFIIVSENSETKVVDGFLSSWVQQISFNPLLVSFCVKPGRPCYDSIMKKEIFTINVVGDHERNYLKHFWRGYDPQNNPFEALPLEKSERGGLLLKEAKSVIECRMVQSHTPGDHTVVWAEVLGSYVLNEDSKPVTHIRKSGLDY
jgi:3-hydroxy-9,10-secoandrosta-1,3,5(10)-triene-9,17-dione monooxygenase reductase component